MDDESPLVILTQVTGLDQRAFIDLFGAAWSRVGHEPDGYRYDTDLLSAPVQLFVFGDPTQLAAKVTPIFPDVQLTIGLPEVCWDGHTPTMSIIDEVEISLPIDQEEVRHIVTRLLRKRRRTFRYCRYCGTVTPPEHGGATCHGCRSQWLGVVF